MNVVSFNGKHAKIYEHALIVSRSKETISCIKKEFEQSAATLLFADTEELIFEYLTNTEVSYIIVDTSLSDIGYHELVRSLRANTAGKPIPIILLASQKDDLQLSSILSSGYDDILFKPFTSLALSARLASIEKIRELNNLYECSLKEQILAKKILTNAIDEISIRIDEISLLSISKNIFSGDIFMTARHPDGSLNVLLADFTGHGMSAAICALPVANIFSAMTEKGFDVDYIVENLNRKLHTLLPTSMFMACSILNISADLKHMKVWNGGMPDIYIRNNISGSIRHKISSTHLPLGITETDSNQFNPITLEIEPGDMLILFTDGLSEAMNSYNDMFGEHRVEQSMHDCSVEEPIFISVVNAFDSFCGDVSPVDDVTLASIPCTMDIMDVRKNDDSSEFEITVGPNTDWRWSLELAGTSLYEINPVPIVINSINKKYGSSDSVDELSNILSLLYDNLTEQRCSVGDIGEAMADVSNNSTIDNSGIYIKITMKEVCHNRIPALLVQVVDTGKLFSNGRCIDILSRNNINLTGLHNKKESLIYELNTLSNKPGAGNRLDAIVSFQMQHGN